MMAERGVIAWMANNPVAANLLMFMVLLAGALSIPTIKKEVFPTFPSSTLIVKVPYPGSSPEEVEEGVVIKVEEAIQDLNGIKEISSVAREGLAEVTVQINVGFEISDILNQVTARVNGITSFPAEAEEPVVEQVLSRVLVINVGLSGYIGEANLKELADDVRDELLTLGGISQVDIRGTRDYEISIELSDATLRQYGLTFDQVVQRVRDRSRDLPAGNLRTEAGTVVLRSEGQAYRGEDFASLPIISRPDGTRLTLADLATVRDGFTETPVLSHLNGEPAVGLRVYSIGDQDALDISEQVLTYTAQRQASLPEGVTITAWNDRARLLKSRLELLLKSAAQGGFLVMLTLALFLRLTLAFWVVLGIPFCFLGAVWILDTPLVDGSINAISLFGFILVLGIVVDDAIVTSESAYSTLEAEGDGINSIIRGVKKVSMATIFGVLTTMLAFVPMLMIEEGMGRFFNVMGYVVMLSLAFSIIETKLVLPSHLRHMKVKNDPNQRGLMAFPSRLQAKVGDGLKAFVVRYYRPSLRFAVAHRYASLAAFMALFMIVMAMVPAGWVRFIFFPNVPSDYISGFITLPEGTAYQVTHDYAHRAELAAKRVNARFRLESGVDVDAIEQLETVSEGDTKVNFLAALLPSTEREVTSVELVQWWRDELGALPGIKEMSFKANAGPGGSPVDIQLASDSLADLRQAAAEVRLALQDYSGVFDIRDTFGAGGPEVNIRITAEGEALGLGQVELARQVRQAFFGAEVQRVQRGRHEVRVYVRLPKEQRDSLETLHNMWVRLADGTEVPFSVVGVAEQRIGISTINHFNRQRVVNIRANIDKESVEPDELMATLEVELLQNIATRYPSIEAKFVGEAKEQAANTDTLVKGGYLVLALIYAALAIPLRSYFKPLIIMSVIPFGMVGAILGHLAMDKPLSILSIIGIIALSGVVVNDSLVLVDSINQRIKEGVSKADAILQSGERRFRAVILTSATTFVGLLPIQLETSIQAQFLKPMAISVGFGVLFATFITLLLVPLLFFVTEDLRRWAGQAKQWLVSIYGKPEASK